MPSNMQVHHLRIPLENRSARVLAATALVLVVAPYMLVVGGFSLIWGAFKFMCCGAWMFFKAAFLSSLQLPINIWWLVRTIYKVNWSQT